MALSDMWELVDRQTRAGQEILNVYHVVRVDAGATAINIAEAFDDKILLEAVSTQVTSLSHDLIEVRNLDDPTDFAVRVPTNNAGDKAGDGLATFDAASILFHRTRTDMRNGFKRLDAGSEVDRSGNSWIAAFITQMTDLAQAIVDPWTRDATPGVIECRFVVIKRVCTVQPPPTPCPSYRLPITDGELVFYQPLIFTVGTFPTSQVSRKQLST